MYSYSPKISFIHSCGPPGLIGKYFLRKLWAHTQNYGPLAHGPALVSTPAVFQQLIDACWNLLLI